MRTVNESEENYQLGDMVLNRYNTKFSGPVDREVYGINFQILGVKGLIDMISVFL